MHYCIFSQSITSLCTFSLRLVTPDCSLCVSNCYVSFSRVPTSLYITGRRLLLLHRVTWKIENLITTNYYCILLVGKSAKIIKFQLIFCIFVKFHTNPMSFMYLVKIIVGLVVVHFLTRRFSANHYLFRTEKLRGRLWWEAKAGVVSVSVCLSVFVCPPDISRAAGQICTKVGRWGMRWPSRSDSGLVLMHFRVRIWNNCSKLLA